MRKGTDILRSSSRGVRVSGLFTKPRRERGDVDREGEDLADALSVSSDGEARKARKFEEEDLFGSADEGGDETVPDSAAEAFVNTVFPRPTTVAMAANNDIMAMGQAVAAAMAPQMDQRFQGMEQRIANEIAPVRQAVAAVERRHVETDTTIRRMETNQAVLESRVRVIEAGDRPGIGAGSTVGGASTTAAGSVGGGSVTGKPYADALLVSADGRKRRYTFQNGARTPPGMRRVLVWKGFLWESDKEDLLEVVRKIHHDVNGGAGIEGTVVDPETGRPRDGIFCKGKLASAVFVTFKTNREMWAFLVANKGKKHTDPNTLRPIWPKVDADKEEEEMAKRVGKAFSHLRTVITAANPEAVLNKVLATDDHNGTVHLKFDTPVKRNYKILERDGQTWLLKKARDFENVPMDLQIDGAKLTEINTLTPTVVNA